MMQKRFDLNSLNKYVQESDIVCEKHPAAGLIIYGYYSDDSRSARIVWDKTNIHCRGLILNDKGDVIEHPFTKFWSFKQYITRNTILLNDNQIFKIPDCSYRILEKIDGTMVTLYWIENKPYLATQRSFTNIKAKLATEILYEKYSHTFNRFNRNYTYVFEAVYPETKVLINYGETRDLYLIGIIDKETGSLVPLEDIGFPTAKDYTPEYGHIKNFDELAGLDLPNQEGFVIHYDNGDLVKIKFPWYIKAHHILDYLFSSVKKSHHRCKTLNDLFVPQNKRNKIITQSDIWKCLRNNDNDLWEIRLAVSDYYYMFGLEYWLNWNKNILYDLFLKTKSLYPTNNDNEVWDRIKPDKNSNSIPLFDIEERKNHPHIYETIVWNWEKRFF